ncbi:MAG: large ribosomal subunit protein bL28 [Candidatus Dojkabacteria bacterium]
MARKCELTGRKTRSGGNRKHRRGSSGAGGNWRFKSTRTTRKWNANLRKVKVMLNGKVEKMTVSMKAYKKLRKGESIDGYVLAQ